MESISLSFPHVVMLPRHLNVFTPLFRIQHCYELLWMLHCPKGRYCDVTIIRPLLFHGMRTDLRGSPGAAIVDCQSIYYLLDFKRICFIFPWNNSTYDLESLGYSINARAFGPLMHTSSSCWLGWPHHVHTGKQLFVKSYILSFQSIIIFISTYVCTG